MTDNSSDAAAFLEGFLMRFNYSIAGIGICCELPFELKVLEESVPFLVKKADIFCDVKVSFFEETEISKPKDKGTWKLNRLFYSISDGEEVYYFPNKSKPPYACAVYGKRHINIAYTRNAVSFMEYSRDFVDHLSLERLLLNHHGLIVHASFIRWRNCGIIFSAPSGTGKSTQADLWIKYEKAECLNGDRTGIRKSDGRWNAYGLPYAGTSGIYRNESAPLTAIVMLGQGKENTVRRLSPVEAFKALYPETLIHQWDSEYVREASAYILELVKDVPAYRLTCLPDEGAVRILKEELIREV